MSREMEIALKAAKAAGKVIMNGYGNIGFVRQKSERLGNVTDIDFKAQKAIKEVISKFSKLPIIGEEDETHTFVDNAWIIDPIDGTNNFSRGLKIFAVSIALVKNKQPVLGVVFNPATKELFSAEKSKGAFLNNKKIFVSDISELKDCVVDVGLPTREKVREIQFGIMQKIYPKKVHYKQFGSAALQLCFIAAGWIDAFVEYGLFPWDFAAGVLIVEEAGGKITNIKGEKIDIFKKDEILFASNGKIHSGLLGVLQ